VYASVITNKACDIAGVAYFSAIRLRGAAIVCLDVAQGPLTPVLLQDILQQLSELREHLSCRGTALFTSTQLAAEFERIGCRAEVIDGILKDEVLAVSCSRHIGAGRVQVCREALTKGYPLSFLSGTAVADDGDPLSLAFLAGIALGLDTGRSLGRAAACGWPRVRQGVLRHPFAWT
jgi:hypothetical protein